jgi:Arc/MetJ family transcription regulator
MRTTIQIDDELIVRAMRMCRLATKREAADYALRRLVPQPLTVEEALAMEGAGWAGDLQEVRGALGVSPARSGS